MRNTQEETTFELDRTPHVSERVGKLYLPEHLIRADDDARIVDGVKLQDFLPGKTDGGALARGFGSYLLADSCPAPAGYLGFVFVKPKTDAEMRTPFRVRVKRQLHDWHDWMRCLYAITDAEVPYEIVTAVGSRFKDRVFDRVEIIDGGRYQSEVTIEEFFNPTPTPPNEFTAITPQPTTISYSYLGADKQLTCLHPLVTIPEQHLGGRLVQGFGTANARRRWQTGDIYPATNLPGWVEHYFADDEDQVNGGYYRVRKMVRPLYIPKPTYR
jgi:hypothetical protein